MLSNPLVLPNRPSSLDSVNSKANPLNLSLGTRSNNSNQVHLFSVNRTRAVVPLVLLAHRRRLRVSRPPQQEDRPPLEVRGIQETPFCQSQRLGVAHPLA
jgi:hypothetical protein